MQNAGLRELRSIVLSGGLQRKNNYRSESVTQIKCFSFEVTNEKADAELFYKLKNSLKYFYYKFFWMEITRLLD